MVRHSEKHLITILYPSSLSLNSPLYNLVVDSCFLYRTDSETHTCVVLSTAHADKFLETLSDVGIERKPCERVQSLLEKPTKYKEMKMGDNWDKILMDTICSITDGHRF